MRCYYQGSGYRVAFNENDVNNFVFPCHEIPDKGYFEFAANGDLIDKSDDMDGFGVLAFSHHCQEYGQPIYTKRRNKKLSKMFYGG